MLALIAASCGACASREELIAKSGVVPGGVDLSGRWQLRDAGDDSMRQIDAAAMRAAGAAGRDLIPPSRGDGDARPARRARGALVYVFLETGRYLKITQTGAGLFISFDRAVVEEYRFGEKCEISVGEITAQRVSGWEGRAYTIETLDRNGAKLIERYELRDAGTVLARSIRVFLRGGDETLDITQLFDREGAGAKVRNACGQARTCVEGGGRIQVDAGV